MKVNEMNAGEEVNRGIESLKRRGRRKGGGKNNRREKKRMTNDNKGGGVFVRLIPASHSLA